MAKLIDTELQTTAGATLIRTVGSLVKVSTLVYTPRQSVSQSADGVLFDVTYNKLYDSSRSNLIVKLDCRGTSPYSGVCGAYLAVAGNRNYSYSYLYSNGSEMTMFHGIGIFTGIGAGNQTIRVGWSPNDGSSGQSPFQILNPNAGEFDARFRDQDSTVTVWEYTI